MTLGNYKSSGRDSSLDNKSLEQTAKIAYLTTN